jgi:hypothetical protein
MTKPAYRLRQGGYNGSGEPPGATLSPVGPAGGGLALDPGPSNSQEAPYVPSVSVVATFKLAADMSFSLPTLPSSPSNANVSVVLADGANNGVLGLSGGAAASYTMASTVPGSTSYAFTTPMPYSSTDATTPGMGLVTGTAFSIPQPGLPYPVQYSTAGGNVTVTAGRDIIHQGSVSDELPNNWLYRRGAVANGQFTPSYDGGFNSTSWWIDFSNFTQGIGALSGGNVTLKAGRDVYNVDAVAPTNAWMPYSTTTVKPDGSISIDLNAADQPLFEYGGGNVSVSAGRNISGGIDYVEKGNGFLTAGGAITDNSDFAAPATSAQGGPLATTLFLGKGGFTVSAAGSIMLGQVANAFMLPQAIMNGAWYRTYFSTYGADDQVNVRSLSGSVTIAGGNVSLTTWLNYYDENVFYSWLELSVLNDTSFSPFVGLMPPTLKATAFSGDINLGSLTLAPSSSGNLTLLASGSITGFQQTTEPFQANLQSGVQTYHTASINLSDADRAAIPSIRSPQPMVYVPNANVASNPDENDITNEVPSLPGFTSLITETGATRGANATAANQTPLHDATVLHKHDPEPVRLYARGGDVTSLTLFSPKSTDVFAGRDILDIAFYLQNLQASDVSSVIAGRDIVAYDANTPARQAAEQAELVAQSSPTKASAGSSRRRCSATSRSAAQVRSTSSRAAI